MTSVKILVHGEIRDKFSLSVEVRLGCVSFQWFNVYMNGVMTEVNAGVLEIGVKISQSGENWSLSNLMLADNSVLMASSEGDIK